MGRKSTKKIQKPKSVSKRTRSRKVLRATKIADIDQLYGLLNVIQTDRKAKNLRIVDLALAPIIENILNDLELEFQKFPNEASIVFCINPPPEPQIQDINLDDPDDETLENGFLF